MNYLKIDFILCKESTFSQISGFLSQISWIGQRRSKLGYVFNGTSLLRFGSGALTYKRYWQGKRSKPIFVLNF